MLIRPTLRHLAAFTTMILMCAVATIVAAPPPPAAAAGARTPTAASPPPGTAHAEPGTAHAERVCSTRPAPGKAACLSLRRTDVAGRKGVLALDATPAGYGPTDLQDAYQLPSGSAGSGQTVAIIDAFDDPNAEADLQVYRQQFGLPECTTANGCFTKLNQRGEQGNYPRPDMGWAGEISLDLDMVSAICPNCHILLVESDDNNLDNLGVAVNQAVALGASYVSNSYGAPEDPSDTTTDTSFYRHPGVAITASSGDSGFGTSYPATSPFVTAVGGTSLTRDTSTRGWAESAWAGAGSGCSSFETDKPSWQDDGSPGNGCANRTVADVSAEADPSTGVAVYDTFQESGWKVFGGTSVAAPIIASTYALAGKPTADTFPAQYVYDGRSGLNDVTTGRNGTCSPTYLCTAGPGFDGPTGLGTPNGVSAFTALPRGTVTGTVTDTETGKPIAGAKVNLDEQTAATTTADGTYRLRPLVGTYDLTTSAFGHQPKTINDVVVTENQTTTQDIALDPLPNATLRGTVHDGSGHGWPLYAKVSAPGTGASTYTDPETGAYELSLPQGSPFDITVDPAYPGYQQATASVQLGADDETHDFTVPVNAQTCAAPGYEFHYTGPRQTFDTTSTPAGWNVDSESAQGFEFDNPSGLPNNTGGAGNFAVADPAHYGIWQDTSLTSPAFDLSAATNPIVEWKQDISAGEGSTADVDLSIDGGPWKNLYRLLGEPHGVGVSGPNTQAIALPGVTGHSQARLRFHFTADLAAFWWAVDDVFIGNRVCTPTAGGLIIGNVTDAGTGDALNGATLTNSDDPTETATARPTPDDPATADGFYHLFTAGTGKLQLIISASGHARTKATVTDAPDTVTRKDVALRAH